MDDYLKELEKRIELMKNVIDIDYEGNYFQKLTSTRSWYHAFEKEIIDYNSKEPNRFYEKDNFRWRLILNQVERMALDIILTKGRMPLYPQYPVLNYFLDFGNPLLKIGFEIDGRKFHNIENDKSRDYKLKNEGWTIYRVSGTEIMRTNFLEYYDFDFTILDDECIELTEMQKNDLIHWLLNTGDGVLEAIKIKYFTGYEYVNEKHLEYFEDLVEQTLQKHTIV